MKIKKSLIKKILRNLLAWAFVTAALYFSLKILKPQLLEMALQFLAINTRVLVLSLFYTFLGCGLLLLIIGYWVGWDNIRYKWMQRKYRAKLVCKDYYKEFQRVRMAALMSDKLTAAQRKQLKEHPEEKFYRTLKEREEAFYQFQKLETQLHFKNGKLHGVFHSYHPNGKLEAEIPYVEGKIHGSFITYYDSGMVHNERSYREGKLNGVCRAYDEDGGLFFEMHLKDDVQHGIDRVYYPGGIVQFEDIYVEGKKIKRRTYDTMGILKYEHNYEDGKKSDEEEEEGEEEA